jgi:hypothetical protein
MFVWHGVQLACDQSLPHVIVVVFGAVWQVKQSGTGDGAPNVRQPWSRSGQ